jgi:uncharacterized protein (DUF362 family)
MKSQVYVVATAPAYGEFPYDRTDDPVRSALGRLWSAWDRSPTNPFGDWVGPGGTVVIKPNWVMDYNPLGHNLDSLVTHTSLIRHMIDACAAAMAGTGTVIVGDCPLQGCDFRQLQRRSRMTELVGLVRQRFPGLRLEVQDWRLTVLERRGQNDGPVVSRQVARHNRESAVLNDYELVDLAGDSFLEELSDYAGDFRVTMYKPSLMRAHHQAGRHEYLVARCAREADLFINLPKMKTHAKAGLTGALKNLVGINGHKEFLPHHIKGSYFEGGDGYCQSHPFSRWADRWYDDWWESYEAMSVRRRRFFAWVHHMLRGAAVATGGSAISAGSWSGNETLWRTILDLNHLLYFGPKSPRHILTFVDGIVAGEGDGPLRCSPRTPGLLVAGENPACLDAVLTHLMGYNLARIPTVYHALTHRKSRFAVEDIRALDVTYVEANGEYSSVSLDRMPRLDFRKPRYWTRAAVRR